MGGGVAIDLVHEWDYLTWLMGFPQEVRYFGGTYSALEIDSDDLAVYMGRYSNRIVELHLDYFGRRSQRTLELFTAGEVITLDLLAGTVSSASGGNWPHHALGRCAGQLSDRGAGAFSGHHRGARPQ